MRVYRWGSLRCYITNLPKGSSATIAHAIRHHWQVESTYWVLDVVFGEDACRKRVYNAAENYSRMMKVVMSLLRNHKKKTGGNKIAGKNEKTSRLEYARVGRNPL